MAESEAMAAAPVEPTPFGLYVGLHLLTCGLANVVEWTPAEWDANGRPVKNRVVPKKWKLHSPCPHGLEPVEARCFDCKFAALRPILYRPIPESQGDALQESAPGQWRPAGPVPFGR